VNSKEISRISEKDLVNQNELPIFVRKSKDRLPIIRFSFCIVEIGRVESLIKILPY